MKNCCKNCKFWTRLKYYTVNRKNYVEYYRNTKSKKAHEHISRFGECECEKIIYTSSGYCIEDDDGDDDNPSDALLFSDNEAYGAYFMTGEDFGCIHYEEKD